MKLAASPATNACGVKHLEVVNSRRVTYPRSPSPVTTALPPPPPTMTAPSDGESPAPQPAAPSPSTQDLQAAYAALQRSRRTLQESMVLQPVQNVLAQAEQDTWQALQASKPVMAGMAPTRSYLDRKPWQPAGRASPSPASPLQAPKGGGATPTAAELRSAPAAREPWRPARRPMATQTPKGHMRLWTMVQPSHHGHAVASCRATHPCSPCAARPRCNVGRCGRRWRHLVAREHGTCMHRGARVAVCSTRGCATRPARAPNLLVSAPLARPQLCAIPVRLCIVDVLVGRQCSRRLVFVGARSFTLASSARCPWVLCRMPPTSTGAGLPFLGRRALRSAKCMCARVAAAPPR